LGGNKPVLTTEPTREFKKIKYKTTTAHQLCCLDKKGNKLLLLLLLLLLLGAGWPKEN
jgi:hypothetical protein